MQAVKKKRMTWTVNIISILFDSLMFIIKMKSCLLDPNHSGLNSFHEYELCKKNAVFKWLIDWLNPDRSPLLPELEESSASLTGTHNELLPCIMQSRGVNGSVYKTDFCIIHGKTQTGTGFIPVAKCTLFWSRLKWRLGLYLWGD